MKSRLTVQPVSTIPCDQQVRDYDQLDSAAQQFLAELTDEGTEMAVSARVSNSFDRGEIVKYTRYLHIRS